MFAILILLADLVATVTGVLAWDWFSGTGCVPGHPSPAVAAWALVLSIALSGASLIKGVADDPDVFKDAGGSAFALGVVVVVVQLVFVGLAVLSGGVARGADGACAMSRSIAVWTGLATVAGFGWNLLSTHARYARWWALPLAGQTAVLLWGSITLRHWALYTLCLASALLVGYAWQRYRPAAGPW